MCLIVLLCLVWCEGSLKQIMMPKLLPNYTGIYMDPSWWVQVDTCTRSIIISMLCVTFYGDPAIAESIVYWE